MGHEAYEARCIGVDVMSEHTYVYSGLLSYSQRIDVKRAFEFPIALVLLACMSLRKDIIVSDHYCLRVGGHVHAKPGVIEASVPSPSTYLPTVCFILTRPAKALHFFPRDTSSVDGLKVPSCISALTRSNVQLTPHSPDPTDFSASLRKQLSLDIGSHTSRQNRALTRRLSNLKEESSELGSSTSTRLGPCSISNQHSLPSSPWMTTLTTAPKAAAPAKANPPARP